MSRVFLLAVLAVSALAEHETPLAAPSGQANKAWALLKESLQDQAPLLSSIRAEERKAKSSNLRASKVNKTVDPEDFSDEVADSERADWLEAAEEADAEAAAMRNSDGTAVDSAFAGKEDTRPVNDTASQFEHDVSELILGLGKGGLTATPMGSSVRKMKQLITKVMLNKVRQAHKNDQKALNRLARSLRSCGGTKDRQLRFASTKESTYKEKSPLHKSCRTDEANYATESKACEVAEKQARTMAKLTCKTFDEIEKSVASQVVNAQLVKKAASEQSETYVRRLTATVCGSGGKGNGGSGEGGYLDRFLSAKQECKKRTRDYSAKKSQCKKLAEKYSLKKTECNNMQAQMDNAACTWAVQTKDACENYMGCYNSKKTSYNTLERVVKKNEKDRKAEWRGLKRMQCLIDAFGDARVTDSEVDACKKMKHDTSRLNIRYPKLRPLEACQVPRLYPATAAYKRAEFAKLPALAKGDVDANECTGVEEVSTTPAPLSPTSCKCERITVLGTYAAGPLIKCTGCIDVYRSQQRNSCPRGTKLFSPSNPQDWQVVMDSGGPLRDPHWIVDVTRSQGKCTGCRRQGMNSRNRKVDRAGWETSDDSPWWITRKRGGLRMDMDDETVGMGYAANCYLNIASARNVNRLTFNAGFCNYHSKSYYCQPIKVSTRPKRGSPSHCKCTQVALTGKYSAGSLIKCEQCWSTNKARDRNSCPKGTKIFSPANRRDWKTVLDSAGPLKSPHWIVDITRPQSGCPGCNKSPMRSSNPRQASWRTSDGSPWWISSTKASEPNGNYDANCYIAITNRPANGNDIRIDDNNCHFKSSSYYCQPARPRK